MKISVVIPTYNRPKDLGKVLKSLTLQTFKNFEVVIVEGGEKEPTQAVVEKFSRKLNIIFSHCPHGLVAQENKALEIMTGEIFLRTDDDVDFDKNWLKEIAATFKKPPNIGKKYKLGGVTGPTIIPKDRLKNRDVFLFLEKLQKGSFIWRLLGKIYLGFFMEGRPMDVGTWFKCGAFSLGSNYKKHALIKKAKEVDFLQACNLAAYKKLIIKAGGFKEGGLGIGEYNEAGVGFDIRNQGYTLIYNPKAIVYHLLSTSGVFSARPDSGPRITNFIHFYYKYIKPNTPSKAVRFFSYILFQNLYYSFMFIKSRNIKFLGSWPASIAAIFANMSKKPHD